MAETIPASVDDAPKTPPPGVDPPDHQTPIVHKTVTQPFSMNATTTKDMKKIYERIALETEGHYLVCLEPEKFLEEFLPWNGSTPDTYKQKCPSKQRLKKLCSVAPQRGQTESVMYKPFVNALNGWVTKAALTKAQVPDPQALCFLYTNQPDTSCNNLNPDISTYWGKDLKGHNNFSRQQTHQEFKPDVCYDPFQHVSDEGRDGRKAKTRLAGEDEIVEDEVAEEESDDDGGMEDEDEDNNHDHDHNEGEEEEGAAANVGLDHDDMDGDLLPEEPQEEESQEEQPPDEEYVALNDEAQIPQPTPTSSVETDTMSGIHTRGQIAAYAGLGLSMSFRKHFFSILILGRYARFIRWDRRGAIVTHRYDYTNRPRLIFDFYLRYGQLTLLQRGFDPTVELHKGVLPKSVRRAFECYHQSSWYGGAKFKRGDAPLSFKGFFRMEVTDGETKCTETFFIPPPKYTRACLFPFYRATRRSLACRYEANVESPRMCFQKDSWQEESQRTYRKATIYRMLATARVEHVASMRLGGDVDGMETETQEWATKLSSNLKRSRRKMICHRIILDTVARDLSTFTWCKVLLSCIADAIERAQQAYKAGILHRDLSAGNIMIVKDKETKKWRGVLIDWDMCLLWKEHGGGPRSGRTGTWAFISARILQSQGTVTHTLWDDMESALWVPIYQALLYLKHDKEPSLLYKRVQLLFSDNTRLMSGEVVGGDEKMNVLHNCWDEQSDTGLTQFKIPGVNDLLNALGKVFYHPYHRRSKGKQPPFNLDNPDENWFSQCLRDAAMKMEPLCITPAGLGSPTNDSCHPDNPEECEPARIKDSKMDYYLMPIASGDVGASTKVKMRQASQISSGLIHGMDGSYIPSKRSHVGESEDEEEEPVSKRQRR